MAKGLGINIVGSIPELGLTHAMYEDANGEAQPITGARIPLTSFDNWETVTPIKTVVSEKYYMLQHYAFLPYILNRLPELKEYGTPEIKFHTWSDGAGCKVSLIFPTEIPIKGKDTVNLILTYWNSVDGSLSYKVTTEAGRLICSNGMMIRDNRFDRMASKIKHIQGAWEDDGEDMLEDIFTKKADEIVQRGVDFSIQIGLWKEYAKHQITGGQFVEMLEEINVPEREQEKIMLANMRDGDNSSLLSRFGNKNRVDGWTAYNSLTQWNTDYTTNISTQQTRGEDITSVIQRVMNLSD